MNAIRAYIERFINWWKGQYQGQGAAGKALLIIITAVFACCVCSVPFRLFVGSGATPDAAEVAEATAEPITPANTAEPRTNNIELEDTSTNADLTITNIDAPAKAELTNTPRAIQAATNSSAATSTPLLTKPPQATATQVLAPNSGELRELTADELTLRATIDEALGESNRSLGRKLNLFSPGLPGLIENSIIIGWAANDADSNALIREGMERDTLTVLRAVVESGIGYDAVLIGSTYPVTNQQFNITDEMEVLTLNYSRDALNGIDWENITSSEVFEVADLFILDPTIAEAPTDAPTATTLPPAPIATSEPPTAVPPTSEPPPAPTATLAPSGAAGAIIITNVNKREEYVDIQNVSGTDIDLSGWNLRSEKGPQDCPLHGLLAAGATLRIWAMSEDTGEGGFNCGHGSDIWNNNDPDAAVLIDPNGNEVARR